MSIGAWFEGYRSGFLKTSYQRIAHPDQCYRNRHEPK